MTAEINGQEATPRKSLISRRVALRRAGGVGILATAGLGLVEMFGATSANAKEVAKAPVVNLKGRPVRTQRKENPDSCCGYELLAVGHCGGPCSSGYWCYFIESCGYNGFYCASSDGADLINYCT